MSYIDQALYAYCICDAYYIFFVNTIHIHHQSILRCFLSLQ